MDIIYNLIISIYKFLITINALFDSKSKDWIVGRKNLWRSLELKTKNIKNIVWFHCASYGEYEQVKELIKAYKLKHNNHKILLTFFSPSGYCITKRYTTKAEIRQINPSTGGINVFMNGSP